MLTDADFKTWDRHFAENVLAQRDDALARIAAYDDERAKIEAAHAETKAALEAAQRDNADLTAKIANMEGHPDVMAARKEKLQRQMDEAAKELAKMG